MDLSQALLDEEGKPMKSKRLEDKVETDKEGNETIVKEEIEEDLTARIVIDQALMFANEETDPNNIQTRYALHKRLKEDEIELSPKEKTIVEECVCVRWNIYIAGQLMELL